MANEFAHASQGTTLTQAEFEGVGLHVCNSQATGDLIYASSTTQLSRLGIGTAGYFLIVSGGIPAWSNALPDTIVSKLYNNNDGAALSLYGGTSAAGHGVIVSVQGIDNGGAGNGAFKVYTPNAAGDADVQRLSVSCKAATAITAWSNTYHTGFQLGLAGTATGSFTIQGATSGVVTITVAATAGTWSLTLPADDGDAGEQLQTNGSGITTWEAAGSLSAFKNLMGKINPKDALARILSVPVYNFKYRNDPNAITTGDFNTEYVGVLGEDAPWAMHHNGKILNPVNTFGYTVASIQALNSRVEALEARI